jgi:hypothetical protein
MKEQEEFQPQAKASAATPFAVALRISKKRLLLAFVLAGLADAVCFFATPVLPVVWAVDLATAILLFVVLGWNWFLLPGLVLEAIPGIGVIPIWLLVVGVIALWGTARPNLNWLRTTHGEKP